jgi:isochorismate hydrolase
VGLTALDAWERDFKVILAGDAILGTDAINGQLMLDYLKQAFAIEPVSNAEVKRLAHDGFNSVNSEGKTQFSRADLLLGGGT